MSRAVPAKIAARPRPPALDIDIVVQSDLWRDHPAARRTLRRALLAAAGHAGTPPGSTVAVALTDDAGIRSLNAAWRGKDSPTNVLSFPAAAPPGGTGPRHLGDIVLALETLAREAAADGKPFAHHLAHLAVHGFLHLIGHDHEDEAEAERMEAAERKILAGLRIPDPYAEPPQAHAIKPRR